MANLRLTCACALAGLLMWCAPAASASLSITVTAGQWVTLPAAEVVRVDTDPADVATASREGDAVRIYGVRPGAATLLLTTPDGVEARPIQVITGPAPAPSLGSQLGRCPILSYVKAAEPSHLALGMSDLALDWTPSNLRLEWTPPDVRVLASNALATPLQQLGVPAAPGLQAEWRDQWRLLAGDGLALVGYTMPGTGTLALGDSALGPAGFADMRFGDAHVSAAALKSPGGQVVGGVQASMAAGPVNLGYTMGPAGGSSSIQLHSGALSASAGTTPTQGLELGLGIAVAPGFTVESSWTAGGGWHLHLAVPLGSGTAAGAGRPSGGGSVPAASQTGGPGCFP